MSSWNAAAPVNFERPPVVEVAVAIQFDGLSRLTTPHVGRFWETVADRFPRVEEFAPGSQQRESFPFRKQQPAQQLLLQLTGRAVVSRCWFVSEDDSQLIQIQADRFVFNWRKRPEEAPYPRYTFVRQSFADFFARFEAFVARHGLGSIAPNQCEISYVNKIDGSRDLARVTTLWRGQQSDTFLPEIEATTISTSYRIQDGVSDEPRGRLHAHIATGDAITLRLTARGEPVPADTDGALAFLDLGHHWIVNGFVSVTTPEMHLEWGRIT